MLIKKLGRHLFNDNALQQLSHGQQQRNVHLKILYHNNNNRTITLLYYRRRRSCFVVEFEWFVREQTDVMSRGEKMTRDSR